MTIEDVMSGNSWTTPDKWYDDNDIVDWNEDQINKAM